MSNPNTVTVSQISDVTTVEITTAGPQGESGADGSGGEANQNAFSNIAVSGQTTVAADSATDTFTLAAGSNVTITTNHSTDTITIAATDTNTTYSVGDGGLTQNNFTNTLKTKLDGIAASANVGITDVVGDTSPQLGGSLDVNGQDIVSVSNGAIELDPNGSGKVTFKGNATKGSGQFVLNCEQNSHGIVFKGPPHSAAASYTFTLPVDIQNAKYLTTDANGNTSWGTPADSTKMPLAGGTFTGSVTFEDAINENVYAITDGNAALDPDNGMIQTWTLGANRTASDSLTAGQSMLLVVTAGSYTLTFPTITWAGGSAPTLATSKPTAIELWKIGSTLYGANVGDLG